MLSHPLMAFGGMGWLEVLTLLGIFVLLFGAKKIPALFRGLGQGISEFKKGMREGAKQE